MSFVVCTCPTHEIKNCRGSFPWGISLSLYTPVSCFPERTTMRTKFSSTPKIIPLLSRCLNYEGALLLISGKKRTHTLPCYVLCPPTTNRESLTPSLPLGYFLNLTHADKTGRGGGGGWRCVWLDGFCSVLVYATFTIKSTPKERDTRGGIYFTLKRRRRWKKRRRRRRRECSTFSGIR